MAEALQGGNSNPYLEYILISVKKNGCLFQDVTDLPPSDFLVSLEDGALSGLCIVLCCWLVGYRAAVGS